MSEWKEWSKHIILELQRLGSEVRDMHDTQDEMNLHIPQTEEARAEAEQLMQVRHQLISPRYGLSVIGCIQDSISGNYLLTKELNFNRAEAIDLLYSVGVDDFSRLPKKNTIST